MTQNTLFDEVDRDEQTRGRRRWPLVVGSSLLVLLAAYVAAAFVLGDRVPRGTTVAGVVLGGQDAEAARATLTRAFGTVDAAPIVLTSTVGEVESTPTDLGVSVDVEATVDGLVGLSLSPADLWSHLAGGSDQPAVVIIDDAVFAAALDAARSELDAEPVEGTLSVADGTATLKVPVSGTRTDVKGTAAAVSRWWPAEESVEVAAQTLAPKVSAQELARVKSEFADVAVSGPVTVTAGEKSFPIAPKEFAPAILMVPDASGTITPRADEKKLAEVVHAAAKEAGAEVQAKDAVVTFSGRTPSVKAHVSGVALDETSLQAEVWKAISTTTRTATVLSKASEPKFTTAIAKATLPKEKISSFTTYYPSGLPRVDNIKLASRVLNGTYIKPGEQFSMNAVLGERTAAKGYVKAGVINNGRAAESVGGGISQVSTTIFNASFFAGVALDAWKPHQFYISRYPEGREATISWPDLHNKFTNTTDGGILMQVSATNTSITVTYWGTKKYDVTATKSARYAIVQPRKYSDDSPGCIHQNPVVGFTVDVGRVIKAGGKVVKTEKFTTKYDPEDDVTCTNPR